MTIAADIGARVRDEQGKNRYNGKHELTEFGVDAEQIVSRSPPTDKSLEFAH